jgi:hypothetical protein
MPVGKYGITKKNSVADVYPGSRIRIFSIPDPGSGLSPSRIPDPHQENGF